MTALYNFSWQRYQQKRATESPSNMFVFVRLCILLCVAGMLIFQTAFSNRTLLALMITLPSVIAMFFDESTTPLKTRAWFNAETIARLALVCWALVVFGNSKEDVLVCSFVAVLFQGLSFFMLSNTKSTLRFPFNTVMGIAFLFGMALFILCLTQTSSFASKNMQSLPTVTLWLLGAMLCASMLLAREHVWTSVNGTRLLCEAQKKCIWPKVVQQNPPPEYWTTVHYYFRHMHWGEKRPWLRQELDEMVAAAPMEYLLAYLHACTDLWGPMMFVPQWKAGIFPVNATMNLDLYRAMFKSIEQRVQALDYRAAIAWSMTPSSQEALALFEQMQRSPETIEQVELPAL